MKKSLLLAILIIGGAGVGTSKAGGAFGINIETGRGYVRGGYASGRSAQPYAYGYGNSYGSSNSGHRYDPREALHTELSVDHSDLHHVLGHQHNDLHKALKEQHKAIHRQLRHERACGVPERVIEARHEAAHRALREQHEQAHHGLEHEHGAGQ